MKKEETNANKRQCPLISSVQVQDPWRPSALLCIAQ